MQNAIVHHGRDRDGFHEAAADEVASILLYSLTSEGAVGRLCTFAYECPDCHHVAYSGHAGGELEPCHCEGTEPDRRVSVLCAGHVYEMGSLAEIGAAT